MTQYPQQFNFNLPQNKEWFSPKEVAAVIGKSDQYVRDCFDNQKILGHASNGRAKKGEEKRKSYWIHRDAVVLFLLETANYEPQDFTEHIVDLLKKQPTFQLKKVFSWLQGLIIDKPNLSGKPTFL